MNFINSLFAYIEKLSNGNQFLSGMLITSLVAGITIVFKQVPVKTFNFIKRQLTTTLIIDNTGYSYYHSQVFMKCMEWIGKNKSFERFSRSVTLDSLENVEDFNGKIATGPGYGKHLLFYKNHPIWVSFSKLDSSGSEKLKKQMEITYLGRNKKLLNDFVDNFTPEEEKDSTIKWMYTYKANEWNRSCRLHKRDINSVALASSIKENLLRQITDFEGNEDWCISNGIPYKLTYIFHGKPGTVKTSMIKALASTMNRHLCILDMNTMTDEKFLNALTSAPEGAFIVMEDFDSSDSTKDRASLTNDEGSNVWSFLTLSGLLNGLDGIRTLHNNVLFLTTNHLDKIDKAIYRKGRVDHIVEFGMTPAEEIKKHFQYIFPEYDCSSFRFEDTLGCELTAALLHSEKQPKKYLEYLESIYNKSLKEEIK